MGTFAVLGAVAALALAGEPVDGTAATARGWRRIEVPGARCGDGSPYPVYVSDAGKDPSRVAFAFQGGGACWNALTCFGPIPFASGSAGARPPGDGGIFSDVPSVSPIAGHTLVFFPYCTGDVFAGNHVARYGGMGVDETPYYHWGAYDVRRALDHLGETGVIRFDAIRAIVLYGYSAGAMGGGFHLRNIDRRVPLGADRVILADAPGLHFADGFWERFSREYQRDLRAGFATLGVDFDPHDGLVARHASVVCRRVPHWRVGILQGARDFVMSALFGQLSPFAHERMVYGPGGIYDETGDPSDNCVTFAPRSFMHTFLHIGWASRIRAGGITAMDFARRVIGGATGPNLR